MHLLQSRNTNILLYAIFIVILVFLIVFSIRVLRVGAQTEDRLHPFGRTLWPETDYPVVSKLRLQKHGDVVVEFAIWEDGRLVAQNNPVASEITPKQVHELIKAIEECNPLEIDDGWFGVPDSSMIEITVATQTGLMSYHWDEVEKANYGDNIDPSDEYLKFVDFWKCVNIKIDIFLDSLP